MMGGRSKLKNRVCLNVYVRRGFPLSFIMTVVNKAPRTHQHFSNQRSRRETNHQPYRHTSENRYDRLVDHSNALDLQVVRHP